jgi:hypothetical protein
MIVSTKPGKTPPALCVADNGTCSAAHLGPTCRAKAWRYEETTRIECDTICGALSDLDFDVRHSHQEFRADQDIIRMNFAQ